MDLWAKTMSQPPGHFNRERFLLRCVAWVLGVHFGLWAIVGLSCTRIWYITALDNKLRTVSCQETAKAYKETSEGVLLILVALLAGGGVMTIALRKLKEKDGNGGDDERS